MLENLKKKLTKKIEELFCFKDKLILVGGSGLYVDVICNGLDEMQKISSKIRNDIKELHKKRA